MSHVKSLIDMTQTPRGDVSNERQASTIAEPLAPEEITERRHAADNALASQRLAGLEPDPLVVVELDRYILGELDLGQIIERYLSRVKRGEA